MYADKDELLTKAKNLLQSEVTSISYNTWIKNLEIDSVNNRSEERRVGKECRL